MTPRNWLTAAVLSGIAWFPAGEPSAFLQPADPNRAPLSLVRENVRVAIRGEIAETTVELTYRNGSPFPVEGDFLFPLPKDATVSDFSLTWEGRKMHGEILDANEARRIYEMIVRRRRDPGWIQYVDGRIFRARIFPFPAKSDRAVEIAYAQVLETEAAERRYTFPLRASRSGEESIEELTVAFTVEGRGPRPEAYSPTHRIDAVREENGLLRGGFKARAARPEGDFLLYLPPPATEGEVVFSTITESPAGEDGYFLLTVIPPADPAAAALPKDVVFVVDTSSSLTAEDLEGSTRALGACLGELSPQDRFGIVRFSTGVETFRERLVEAEPDTVAAARKFAEGFRPAGGTNLSGALQEAYRFRSGTDRPFFVVLLTDGSPTVGERDLNRIVAARPSGSPTIRILTVGLGTEVNTHLLDLLAERSGGAGVYLHRGEGLEERIAAFFSRIHHPVLVDVRLSLEGIGAHDLYPPEIPDLFAGEAVRILGRFREPREAGIGLEGRRGGREVRFQDRLLFEEDSGNDFLPRLWARRKVAFLLDSIRLHGETKEIVEEVKSLAMRFGIITPYTASLVIEDESMLEPPLLPVPLPRPVPGPGPRPVPLGRLEDRMRESLFLKSGRSAFEAARSLAAEKKVLTAPAAAGTRIRRVAGRTFRLEDGAWVEESFRPGWEVREIPFGSERYFELARSSPTIRKILSLGPEVLFRWNGVFHRVVPSP